MFKDLATILTPFRKELTTAEALNQLKPSFGKPAVFSLGIGGRVDTSDAFYQQADAACLYDGPGAGGDTGYEVALSIAKRICEQSDKGKIELPLRQNTFIATTIDKDRLAVAAGDGVVIIYYQDLEGVVTGEVAYANVELDSGRLITVKHNGVQSNTYLPDAYRSMESIIPYSIYAFSRPVVTESKHIIGVRIATDGKFETMANFNSAIPIGEENAVAMYNDGVVAQIEGGEITTINSLVRQGLTVSQIMEDTILPTSRLPTPVDDVTDVYIPILLKH